MIGNCYSADHIAEDHKHTDITCNTEEPQQKYRIGKVSYSILGGGDKHVLPYPNPRPLASAVVLNIWSA